MQLPPFKGIALLFFSLLCLSACRSAIENPKFSRSVPHADPIVAAKNLFADHYEFYHEDPTPRKALLTLRFFRVLKHNANAFKITGQVGALDSDPWIDAQDGYISEPFIFETLKNNTSVAIVRFYYTFTLGPKSSRPQSVLMKFQSSSTSAGWQLADFIMPNNESLVDLFEKNP